MQCKLGSTDADGKWQLGSPTAANDEKTQNVTGYKQRAPTAAADAPDNAIGKGDGGTEGGSCEGGGGVDRTREGGEGRRYMHPEIKSPPGDSTANSSVYTPRASK